MIIRHSNCTLDIDVASTREAYAQLTYSSPCEGCACHGCKNFREAMSETFAPAIVSWFSSLGINYQQPCEVYHVCRAEKGFHVYSGWYHCIGTIAGQCDEVLTLADNFSVSFHDHTICLDAPFEGKSVIQIEISTCIPWMIAEQEIE